MTSFGSPSSALAEQRHDDDDDQKTTAAMTVAIVPSRKPAAQTRRPPLRIAGGKSVHRHGERRRSKSFGRGNCCAPSAR